MTNQFDFNSLFAGTNTGATQQPTGAQHSEKMVHYYNDLCVQKNVQPQNVQLMTSTELRTAIDELRKMAPPASSTQLTTIVELVEELIELGSKRKQFPNAYLTRLTGGREGTASQLINQLFEERKTLELTAPPSREQLLTLCTWYICPDIPFDEFGVDKVVYLDEMKSWSYDAHQGTGTEVRAFRQMTSNEFAKELQVKMTRREAASFINQFRTSYNEWKRNQITKEQMSKYRTLELYLCKARVGGLRREDQYAMRQEATTADVIDHAQSQTQNARIEFNPADGRYYQEILTGKQIYDEVKKDYYMETKRVYIEHINFEPISNRTLHMLSKQQADIMIRQLEFEINDISLKSVSHDLYDDSQEALEFKHGTYRTEGQRDNSYQTNSGATYDRLTKDQASATEQEMENLDRTIIFVEAELGHKNDELRELMTEVVLSGVGSKAQRAVTELYNFFLMTVDMTNEETIRDSIGKLYNKAQASVIATKVVDNMRKDFLPGDVLAEQEAEAIRRTQINQLNK